MSVSKAPTVSRVQRAPLSSSPTNRQRVVFRDTAQHRRTGGGGAREDKGSGTRLDNKLTPCQSSPLPAWGWELERASWKRSDDHFPAQLRLRD